MTARRSPLPRTTFLRTAGALGLSLACSSCGSRSPELPSDLRAAASSFSGGGGRSRLPRLRLLQDSTDARLARACLAGARMRALERLGIEDLRTRLDTLAAGHVIRLAGERCEAGFPVFVGDRRRALAREADAAAARLVPLVESLAVRLDSAVGGRRDVAFHLLWSRVMDADWGAAWERAFPRDSLMPAVTWLAAPEHRFHVGTNYTNSVGDGSLAVTWARGFTAHLDPFARYQLELTKLAWQRPVQDDSARAVLTRLGVVDPLGSLRLFAYPDGGPLDSTLSGLARAYGERAGTVADWTEAGRRFATDPRDLFVILLHEIAYSVFERLAERGRLEVPRVLTAGAPLSDAVRLVSLRTRLAPTARDDAMAAYMRSGWHGSVEAVRELTLALRADPADVQLQWFLGLSLYDVGRYREAIARFERVSVAARRDPGTSLLADWARLWTGHCYDALGERGRALAIYRDVARNGEAQRQLMMGQYGIGPITARAWAERRLRSPFRAPD